MNMKLSSYLITLLAVLSAIILPFILAALMPGSDYTFIGFLFNPIDGASYLAKMYQGWSGSWRFTLPYTAQADESAFIFLYYLFLGHLARWLHLPLIWMFHLARLLGAAVFLFAAARFCGRIFGEQPDLIRLAYILVVFGAGMGWAVVFYGPLPSDFWVAEAYPFLSMFANPHFPLGLGLMVLIFDSLIQGPSPNRQLKMALLGLLISFILQFGLVVVLAVAFAYTAWSWKETKRVEWQPFVWLGMAGGPYLLYQYWAILADPVLAGWNAQNQTPSPPAWDFLLSFSPALPLAAWGALKLAGMTGNPARRLLTSWLILGPLLISVPFPLQRRFILGYYIPVAILAVFGLADLVRRFPAWKKRLPRIMLVLALPTNILIILIGMAGALSHAPVLYLTRDEANALAWIETQTAKDAVVLASPEMGLLIPAFTGRKVLYGHPFETLDAEKAEAGVVSFYKDEGPGCAADNYLAVNGVDYVVFGPREQALGSGACLQSLPLAFEGETVRIYSAGAAP